MHYATPLQPSALPGREVDLVNTTREQLAEIGRAFARGDKRTVDQVYEELKATHGEGFVRRLSESRR